MYVDFKTKKLYTKYEYNSYNRHHWIVYEKSTDNRIGYFVETHEIGWSFIPTLEQSEPHIGASGLVSIVPLPFEYLPELQKLTKKIKKLDTSQKTLQEKT